jgi:hypothetical protein
VLLSVLSAALLWSALQARVEPQQEPRRVAPRLIEAGPTQPGTVGQRGPVRAARPNWRAVLARLDRWRADAYAAAEPALLSRVYARGTRALHRDRALLGRYRRRGLRVRGLRMDVIDLRMQAQHSGAVVLVVRERLGAGTVHGVGIRRDLPRDDVDRHRLVLQRRAGRGWQIAAVRPSRR